MLRVLCSLLPLYTLYQTCLAVGVRHALHYYQCHLVYKEQRGMQMSVWGHSYRSGQIAHAMKWEEAANGTELYSCECGLSKKVKYKSVLIKIHLSCNAFYTNYV